MIYDLYIIERFNNTFILIFTYNYCDSIINGGDKMKNLTLKWAKAAGVRAIKTVAQTAIATIGTSAVMASVDWKIVVSASALAGILSILTSVAGLPEVDYQK